MAGLIESFPDMLREAWGAPLPEGYPMGVGRATLFGGMGGSGLAGALAVELLRIERRLALPWRNDDLPEWASPADRMVVLSYSGSTWEAVRMLTRGIERKIPTRVVASGGPLLALARDAGIPAFVLPPELPPRAALPWLLAGALRATCPPDSGAVAAAIQTLLTDRAATSADRDPRAIASILAERLPILVPIGPIREVLAIRLRNQILENAEQAAFVSPLPEMAHNEVMGWPWLAEKGIPVSFVLLPDHWPPRGVWASLVPALEAEARQGGMAFHVIPPSPAEGFAGILADLYLGDRISLALAERRGTAATPVAAIARLREAMRKEQTA
jgi:bifunctional phosphoglucose/phosphomannose isomerase